MHDFKTDNRGYEGKHKEQAPKRQRLLENHDADNHSTYGPDSGPYGISCAEWDCFGGFGEECHTQQTKSGESGVPHNGFVACGEVAFSEAECKARLTEPCNN